jgi:hypothetical protein
LARFILPTKKGRKKRKTMNKLRGLNKMQDKETRAKIFHFTTGIRLAQVKKKNRNSPDDTFPPEQGSSPLRSSEVFHRGSTQLGA